MKKITLIIPSVIPANKKEAELVRIKRLLSVNFKFSELCVEFDPKTEGVLISVIINRTGFDMVSNPLNLLLFIWRRMTLSNFIINYKEYQYIESKVKQKVTRIFRPNIYSFNNPFDSEEQKIRAYVAAMMGSYVCSSPDEFNHI